MIVIRPPKGVRRAYTAIRYGRPKHYVVITFWLLLNWRKFNRYSQRLVDGMGWLSAYKDAWKY